MNFIMFNYLKSNLINFSKKYSSKTIFAVSSGQGRCAVAIIRISGDSSSNALKCITGRKELPKARVATLRSIKHPISKEILDKGIILWFPGPKSFTGEDSCELHVHGGLAVVNSILDALSSVENLQLAEPGEFTRRAFFNGKLDLTEVEGLSDLLLAETEYQRKQAFLQSQGALSELYKKWEKQMLTSLAYMEAYIDFDETETLELDLAERASEVYVLIKEIDGHLDDGRKGEVLRNGVKTCIVGQPNVGKSSLFNLLCGRQAAIVTPIEGTTRDTLEVSLNIGGYPLVLTDTAGLRTKTNDIIEEEGIQRAVKNCQHADLVIIVVDVRQYLGYLQINPTMEFVDYIKRYLISINLGFLLDETSSKTFSKRCVIVLNKIDLIKEFKLKPNEGDINVVTISCNTNEGIAHLIDKLNNELKMICGNPSKEHPSMNQRRHKQHLINCRNQLKLFADMSSKARCDDAVILAEYLRKSINHLEKLVGKVTNDQILDIIFREFCIGK